MIIGLIEWANSFLTSTKNKNCTLLRLLGIYVIIMGQWVTTHVTHPKMVTHLTHDPWPTDPFPSPLQANIMQNSGILLIFHTYIFGQKCVAPSPQSYLSSYAYDL